MRVAFIHPFLFRYARGIERYTFSLANALVRRGVGVDLLTWRWETPIQIDQLDPRVRVQVFPTSRYYAAQAIVPYYMVHFLAHRYDFVWIFFGGYGEAEALTLARWQRFGIVFHYPYTQVPHRYREFQRYGLAKRATQIVSVSQHVAQGVREALGRESVVIHHGVDTQRFAPGPVARAKMREILVLSTNALVLVTAAALEERKGVQWVLRALPKIVEQFPETIYLVVGDGPHRAALEQLTNDLHVADHVRFLGAQADVTPYLQTADVSLILARGEASSLTALESLACGVPVIAARQPPFGELIESAYGIMVDECDASAVSTAILDLLTDPQRRQAMGDAGRARILADFTWERVSQSYLSLMESVLLNSDTHEAQSART
jgi:glycosyltransferase involved in cell wall biosynthesis